MVVSNLRPEYFKKLFPDFKGKLVVEDRDSIYVDGTGLGRDFTEMIKIETK